MANRYKVTKRAASYDTPLGRIFDMTPEERAEVVAAKLSTAGVKSRVAPAIEALVRMIREAEAVAVAKSRS